MLDDIFSKLALISYLTPDIMKDKIVDALDADIVIALRVHFQVRLPFTQTKIGTKQLFNCILLIFL